MKYIDDSDDPGLLQHFHPTRAARVGTPDWKRWLVPEQGCFNLGIKRILILALQP
jgi:hypothetical protein